MTTKSARERFEELGWEQYCCNKNNIVYEKVEGLEGKTIIFEKWSKTIKTEDGKIPEDLFMAVYTQAKELGWLDE